VADRLVLPQQASPHTQQPSSSSERHPAHKALVDTCAASMQSPVVLSAMLGVRTSLLAAI